MWDKHTEYEVKPYDVKNDKQNKTNFNVLNLSSPPFSPLKEQKHEKPPCFVEGKEIERMKIVKVSKKTSSQ